MKLTIQQYNKFRKLIESDLRKKGLFKTYNLIRSIDPEINFVYNKNGITLTVNVLYYYEYLDNGTIYIKKRNITEDVMNSEGFMEIIEEIIFDNLNSEINIIISS